MASSGRVLVTGAAGFIGSHLSERMLSRGWQVVGVDNFDPFYDPAVKRRQIAGCISHEDFSLQTLDIRAAAELEDKIKGTFDVIVHLAAKAGVRPSIEAPSEYSSVNIGGTENMLEFAKRRGVPQFVFASSSSVYGVNPTVPWSEYDHVLLPISPYAGTKVCGELLGHIYSHLYGMRFIALRFFTVYGPRQRPDLAIHRFSRMMLAGDALPLFGDGRTRRDYTYIEDIVDGVMAAVSYTGSAYEVINLGNNHAVSLADLVAGLERALGVPAIVEYHPEQPGDVPVTWANIQKAGELLDYKPKVPFEEGLSRFARWIRSPEGSA